jgi:hypothetical protein
MRKNVCFILSGLLHEMVMAIVENAVIVEADLMLRNNRLCRVIYSS